ncbi:MAG: hypothetical protein ACOYIR_04685 [Christensenellales bacterium]
MLPVLVVYPDEPSFMLVDGMAQIEANRDRPLVLPTAMGSAHYITALPLIPGCIPVTKRVEISAEGETSGAVYWRDCAVLRIAVPRLPQSFEPAALIASAEGCGLTACLFRQGGIHLALEREGLSVWSRTVAKRGWGELSFLDESLVCVTDEGCLCLNAAELVPYLELFGSCALKGGEISCTRSLNTRLEHEERTVYDAKTGELKEKRIIPGRRAESAEDAILGLLDAVRLGLWNEMAELLCGDLSGLSAEELHGFFGEYETAELHPFSLGIAGVRMLSESRMREFKFETEEHLGIFRISNVEEL